MNCWRGLSLFAATIITKLHFCEFWLAPPLHSPPHQGTFESSINEADLLTNDLLSHKILEKCFSEVFIQKWLIGDTAKRSSRYLPGYCQFFGLNVSLWWCCESRQKCRSCVIASNLVSLSGEIHSVWKEECVSLLLSLTVLNHSPSCGKLSSGHNSQPFWTGL